MAFDQILEQGFLAVTENAAIAAAQTMGFGDHERSGQVAVEAMHATLDQIEIAGKVVIGEGERDQAPMLYVGEEVGSVKGRDGDLAVDLAVDPLESTHQCATGAPGAVAVLAASDRGGLLPAPDVYMEKIVVGPSARGAVQLDAPVPENLRNIARAFGREVTDLTVVVLDRERHRQLIADIRGAGARIRVIPDGDLAAAISAAVRGTGVHAVMGTGGAPEGVLAAAAMRCLGGEIQARLKAVDEAQEKRLEEVGITDPDRIYRTEDLAPGDRLVFSCSGVTDGELLRGVRFFGGGSRTSTLFMSLASGIVRFVDTIRREEEGSPVRFR
ncbi:MAG: class II fructose-bisphosphatase [Thermoanaerobaculia bacterium]